MPSIYDSQMRIKSRKNKGVRRKWAGGRRRRGGWRGWKKLQRLGIDTTGKAQTVGWVFSKRSGLFAVQKGPCLWTFAVRSPARSLRRRVGNQRRSSTGCRGSSGGGATMRPSSFMSPSPGICLPHAVYSWQWLLILNRVIVQV